MLFLSTIEIHYASCDSHEDIYHVADLIYTRNSLNHVNN